MTPEFRAWDKKNEIYLYNVQDAYDTLSGFIKYDDGKNATYDESCFGDFLDNKRYDTEQFTGLKDVNGNKIFEGDILKSSQGHTRPFYYLVKYSEQYAAFTVDNLFLGGVSGVDLKPYEVAGNIHNNPELLEVEE